MSSKPFSLKLDTAAYKVTVSVNTGLFIGGKWVDPVEGGTIEYVVYPFELSKSNKELVVSVVNPATGQVITTVSAGTDKDVDIAVDIAKKAYKSSWGLKVPGVERGKILNKFADLMEANADEFAALESLNVGKPFTQSRHMEMGLTVQVIRSSAQQADNTHGETIEVSPWVKRVYLLKPMTRSAQTTEMKFAYTRREPYGVVGAITPWNGPLDERSSPNFLDDVCAKIAPAVAAGNVIVIKPSELTPLTALKAADLINEAGRDCADVRSVNLHRRP
ncbi:hypothetical protein V5O48_015141 [Marasmius crinis-equi]|uniref:Aldehyde dehydrogenase domain-containing protein n=1 Tax=Marasmius crinis-equi TaxID=585013 RepID=A0ABR3EVC6_9AGAR